MDGQSSRRHISHLSLFSILALVGLGVVLAPARGLAQAMGTAQIDGLTALRAAPLSEAAAPRPSAGIASEDLVAIAGDGRKDAALDAPATGTAAKTTTPAILSPAPATGVSSLAPATQPLSSSTSPLEAALIRPGSVKTSTEKPEVGTMPPAAETALYERFKSVGQVGGALVIVVGLILIGRTLVRKYVPGAAVGSGKGVMEVLARYPLAKNQSLVLVRIGSQLVVLNQTRDASQSVLVIHDSVEVANIMGQIQGNKSTSIQQGFSKLLANAQMDLETTSPDGEPSISLGDLDTQLDEMAAAKRQLMELRQQVRSVRESMPAG